MDQIELKAAYWLDLVERSCDELEVQDVFERHGVSLEKVQWIHGGGRLQLPACGIRLPLWKAGVGKSAPVRVIGVEFVLAGMRKGSPYAGDLPHGIRAEDELLAVSLKLHPAMLSPASSPNAHEALWPDHRLLVEFDARGKVKSCAWISTRERRRAERDDCGEPPSDYRP